MNFSDYAIIIVSNLGGQAILFLLIQHLLNIQEKKIINREQADLADRNDRRKEIFESRRSTIIKLWEVLVELDKTVDVLWEKANKKNLLILSEKLALVNKIYDKERLLLTSEEATQMGDITHKLNDFYGGKQQLIELRSQSIVSQEAIYDYINSNNIAKEKFKSLLRLIEDRFRNYLIP